jgi:Na+-transporting methylmalonyl-CoA/oxaloacetate decarboxylase gamma subunit
MNELFLETLLISAVGMTLLFLALLLLTGLMFLLTAVTRERARKPPTAPVTESAPDTLRARAAVIAVALARAEQESAPVAPTEMEEMPSAWRALHQQRQLNRGLPARRSK